MTHATSMITIHASADAIWHVIGNFGAAGHYLAGVVSCSVEGQGVGARRTLTYADGCTVVEHLAVLDIVARWLSYALLTDTPFGNLLTTMSVRDLGPDRAELVWSGTVQPVGIPASEAADLLEGMLAANCLALKHFFER